MPLPRLTEQHVGAELKVCHDRVELGTQKRVQFIDITELVRERIRRSGLSHGIVNICTRHTTTALVVNENEHYLLRDFEQRLETLAPRDDTYRHNDLEARRFQLIAPDERPNGDSHTRALLLGASETLNVVAGVIELGEWQRLFLVELDGPRQRKLSILAMGTSVV